MGHCYNFIASQPRSAQFRSKDERIFEVIAQCVECIIINQIKFFFPLSKRNNFNRIGIIQAYLTSFFATSAEHTLTRNNKVRLPQLLAFHLSTISMTATKMENNLLNHYDRAHFYVSLDSFNLPLCTSSRFVKLNK